MTTPQVWLGCLAAYNEGTLHGKWVEAVDEGVLRDELKQVLESSPVPLAEEWYIGDYDGFGSTMLGEYADLDTVATVGAMIEEHGDEFRAYLQVCDNAEEAIESFDEARCGAYDSEKAFAEDWYEQMGDLPDERWQSFIDWDAVARDLMMDFTYADGYVFRRNV